MLSRRYRARGFTLVEVLVAAVIVSIAIGVNYQLFGRVLQHHADNTARLRAISIAHSLSEALRAFGTLQPALAERCELADISACNRLIASDDQIESHTRLAEQQLPQGSITTQRGGDGRVRILVRWRLSHSLTHDQYRLEALP